ncbi:hypothetical protein GGR58DRAFT_499062 [Xylaria digitata]|nr:hypothetical protein GGR58DRAFT_499062 [Xylaria digitata]
MQNFGNTPDGLGNATTGDPGGSGGNSGGMGEGAESIVYIDPSIWGDAEPVIQFTFPSYVSSLDVAWPASTCWTRTVQTTTLDIPLLVITEIPVWEYTVTDTNTATTVTSSFYITESIRPPPFVVTNDPNPLNETGVTHPPMTRTITPPP